MFGKDKVKGHNRIIKSKSGFKVTRIGDFLRKKDDNRKRNLAIGVGAVSVLGVGAGLFLRKKGIKLLSKSPKLNSATANIPKYPKGITIKTKSGDMVVKKDFSPELDPWEGTYAPVSNPWNTPINVKNKINTSSEMLVKSKSEGVKLLSPVKVPNSRDNLLRTKGTTSKDRVISRLTEGYATLPLPMKVTLQIEKALTKPRRISSLGKPPDTKGLKTILDTNNKTPIEQVISKAKRKVGDRLKRESEIVKKNNLRM